MKVIITNAEEAAMPAEIAANCEQLLLRRIKKTHSSLPKVGEELTILYSEIDPLGEKGLEDDTAYFIYFSVLDIESSGDDIETSTIHVELIF